MTASASKLQRLLGLPALVARHHELLRNFMRREFESEFHGTLLGRLWPVLQPVALIATYYVIFVMLFRMEFTSKKLDVGSGLGAFYIATGVLPWIAFQDALHRSCGIIVEHGNLIKKVAFPSEILPLQVVLVQVMKEIISLLVLLGVLIFVSGIRPHPWMAVLPVALVLQILFTLGLAYLVAALQVFVRDTAPTLGLVTMIWMFGTPIFYSLRLVPASFPLRWWYDWNPMAQLVAVYRMCFLGPEPLPAAMQSAGGETLYESAWTYLGPFALWALAAFVLGFLFFARSRDRFADEV